MQLNNLIHLYHIWYLVVTFYTVVLDVVLVRISDNDLTTYGH